MNNDPGAIPMVARTNQPISVMDLLALRSRQGSMPRRRRDDYHLALVIEGGGMRAVTAGGMVSAIEKMRLTECFDSVHGSSAGAATGAYLIAGQAAIGTSLYYENINNKDFINPLRIILGRPILNTAYLVDFAMTKHKPLNFSALQNANIPLYVACTDIDQGAPYIVSEFRDYEHYRALMKASITLPLIAGASPRVDGRRLLDGGLLEQIAIGSAMRAGATHILTLLTRTEDELTRSAPNFLTRIEASLLQAIYGGKVGKLYFGRNRSINNHLRQIFAGMSDSGALIDHVSLPDDLGRVSRLSIETEHLRHAAARSFEHMTNFLVSGGVAARELHPSQPQG